MKPTTEKALRQSMAIAKNYHKLIANRQDRLDCITLAIVEQLDKTEEITPEKYRELLREYLGYQEAILEHKLQIMKFIRHSIPYVTDLKSPGSERKEVNDGGEPATAFAPGNEP